MTASSVVGTLRCGRDIHILPAVIEKIELLPSQVAGMQRHLVRARATW